MLIWGVEVDHRWSGFHGKCGTGSGTKKVRIVRLVGWGINDRLVGVDYVVEFLCQSGVVDLNLFGVCFARLWRG